MIRPLTPEDRAAWQPLWDAYLTFYEETLDPAITDVVFERLATATHACAGFVTEEDGALIGFTHTVTHPSTWAVDDVVYLEDLFVVPSARGTGAGRALIEHVYAFAGERKVYWHTQATNTVARRLYDRIASDNTFVVYER